MKIELAKKIRHSRVKAELSQKELAAKLGVSDKTISAYEKGRAIPPLPTLNKIADITKQSPNYFFESKSLSTDSEILTKLDIIIKELKKITKKYEKE